MQHPVDDLLPNSRVQTMKALLNAPPTPWWVRVIETLEAVLFGCTPWTWRAR